MSARQRGRRRPLPVPRDLAAAWSDYSAQCVAAGLPAAERWRLERDQDGVVWVAIDNPRRLDGRRRDALADPVHRTRFAENATGALLMLRRATTGGAWTLSSSHR